MTNLSFAFRPKLCIAGIGGYARAHHEIALELETAEELQLIATCDPRHRELQQLSEHFAFSNRSIEVLESFVVMMERHGKDADLVTIATPIHLHAVMHEAVVSRNLACYLEKPPTLDPLELDAMIATEQGSDYQTEVGFNYIAEPWRHDLKRRLLEGEWGDLLSLSFYGAWRRDTAYYQRSPWAGKLLDGRLILDSPFGNAASHHIHNLLFFAGREEIFSWALPGKVRCEMYRAYDIESADTVFSTMTTPDGIELRTAVSHACQTQHDLVEILHCERAEIRIRPYQHVEIIDRSGKREIHKTPADIKLLKENFVHYLHYLRGLAERPLTTLADCRPLVIWNALNYLSTQQIQTVPSGAWQDDTAEQKPSTRRFIIGIEEVMSRYIATGAFPSEQGVCWCHRSESVTPEEVIHLRTAVREMARNTAALNAN